MPGGKIGSRSPARWRDIARLQAITDDIGHPKPAPILLDLDGNDIQLADLTRSTVFMEGEEGLEHRTAWAGAGDGVLFYDTEAVGQAGFDEISDIREYVFIEWDARRSRNGLGDRFRQRTRRTPGTAKDDLAALRSRFDTDGNGKLMGGDGGLQVMVTRTNGALAETEAI